jgi:hypothetical protein
LGGAIDTSRRRGTCHRKALSLMRSTLYELVSAARAENHQVAILGDFNAAPLEGRWGYSRWRATMKEDLIMNEWVQTSGLTEVLQHGKPTQTWRPNEGPKKAMTGCWLPQMLAPCQSSQYNGIVQISYSTAVLLLRIQHSLIGTGYAGACCPDREAFPRSRFRVNLGKWRRHISECH